MPRSVPHTVGEAATCIRVDGAGFYQAGSRLTKSSGVRTYAWITKDICVGGCCKVPYAIWRESVAREGLEDESSRSGFAPVSAALVVGRLAGVGFRRDSTRVPPYFAAAASPSSSMAVGPKSELANAAVRSRPI